MGNRFLIIISSGTADPTKVHVAVVNGFAQLKGDPTNKVDFVLMAEGGWVVEDKVLRSVSAFGLPPIAKLLEDDCMLDESRVTWTVWKFCADARGITDVGVMSTEGKRPNCSIKGATDPEALKMYAEADKILCF